MNRLSQLAKKFDLFSQPFAFFIGKKSKKKTTILGGLLSLSILVISMAYFTYLLYLYFNNKFLPKITSQFYNEVNYQDMLFEKSLFAFQFIAKGQALEDLEKQTGKQYLTFTIYQIIYDKTSYVTNILPITDCQDDPLFEGYKCLDLTQQSDQQKTLLNNPSALGVSTYVAIIAPCSGLPSCASPTEIQDAIVSVDSTFFIKIRINQLNQDTQEYEEGYQLDYLSFDEQLSIRASFNLQRASTSINTGLLIQSTETKDSIIGFTRNTQQFTQNNLLYKAGFEGYAYLEFQINQNIQLNTVQYPMITEILSQFMSIFNILLTVGILAQLFAESRIIEDVNSIYLKEYYKNTALKLISKQDKDSPIRKGKQTKAQILTQLQNQINEQDFIEKQKETFKIGFGQRIKMTVFAMFRKDGQKYSQEQKIYQKMIEQTIERIDIYEVYRDLIKLKMAIKLLLSKEQYAALQFCGCDLNISKENKQLNSPLSQSSKIHPIEFQKNDQMAPQMSNNMHLSNSISNNSMQNKMLPNSILQDLDERKNIQQIDQKEEIDNLEQPITPCYQATSQRQMDNIDQGDNQLNLNQAEKKYFNIEKNLKKTFNSFSSVVKSTKNHLQEIDQIMNSQQLMNKYLQNFIERINSNEQLSQIDINIYSSLIGQNFYDNHLLDLNEKQNQSLS